MNYYYLTKDEIFKLNQALMSKNKDDKNSISSIVKKEIKKIRNGEIGILFEHNVRKTLENEFEFEIADIPRYFFYRKIIFKNKVYVICPSLKINARNFFIEFNEVDNSCNFIEKKTNKNLKKINNNSSSSECIVNNKRFIVSEPRGFEADGLFIINGFSIDDFNTDEVKVIYNNVMANDYEYCVVEIKLNQNKIDEVIVQIKNDSEIISKIITAKTLYLGIVNLTADDNLNLVYDEDLEKIDCALIGIKEGIFCDRIVTGAIDWNLINQFNAFKVKTEKKIDLILQKLNSIMNEKNDERQ